MIEAPGPALRRTLASVARVVCLVALGAVVASAQPSGQLTGVVRDTTGSVLPGVTLAITGEALSAPRTVVTNEHGEYVVDALPAGCYLVTAMVSGFGPVEHPDRSRNHCNDAQRRACRVLARRKCDGDRHEDGRYRHPVNTHCRDGASCEDDRAARGREGRKPCRLGADGHGLTESRMEPHS